MGTAPQWSVVFAVAAMCAAVSFGSSLNIGYEVLFISVVAVRFLDLNLYGAEMTLLGLLPLLNGAGVLIDVLVGGLGASASCEIMGTAAPSPYKDII
jgi:hypothetical protein